ncbi:MAG: hypothetical protein ACOZQL_16535 [Myxococcota bacterium]
MFDARWGQADGRIIRASLVTDVEVSTTVDCTVGTVSSSATAQDLNLFGTPSYFNAGAPLAAGRYRATNMGGCMKYAPTQKWMTQAWADGSSAWWLIGESSTDRRFMLPGVFGWATVGGQAVDQGAETFAECDRLNRAVAPVEFQFAGGRMGIMLVDAIYTDNTPGEGGQNPSWKLTRVLPGCP